MPDLGPQFEEHPNLQPYRSGGIGHRPEDPTKSVIGMVPTHILAKYRHHEGDVNPDSQEVVEGIRHDLRRGYGLENPVMLEYDHREGWAALGEGNHRLRAHELEGRESVPTRVVRSPLKYSKEMGMGAPASHKPIPGIREIDQDSYVPSDIHPSYLNLGAQFHERGQQP